MVDNYRFRFEIRPGKFAYIPTDEHRVRAAKIIETVRHRWKPPNWCFHIGKRGGHIAALRVHALNRWRAALDVEQFFGSVTRSKLTRSLKRIGFSFKEAKEMADISTVRIGEGFALPYGFLQSPLLATLALAKSALGGEIEQLRRDGYRVSVYVDDIVVSHPDRKKAVQDAIERLGDAACRASFSINAGKAQGPDKVITAFNIIAQGNELMITEDRMLEFRQRVIESGEGRSSEAVIRYVAGVNEAQADLLRADLEAV